MKKYVIVSICLMLVLAASGCGAKQQQNANGMQDGTYTAQMEEYSFGWREYVTITVKNGTIVATEYNAENASGFIKSWDNEYMASMNSISGTYPNEYTRYYAAQLTGNTEVPEIEALSGATSSGENFKRLAATVVEQALKGDSTLALVPSVNVEE